jgi:hypothetical protein
MMTATLGNTSDSVRTSVSSPYVIFACAGGGNVTIA